MIACLLSLVIVSVSWLTAQPFLADNQSLIMEINHEGASDIAYKAKTTLSAAIDGSKILGKALLESDSRTGRVLSAQFFKINPSLLAMYVIDDSRQTGGALTLSHRAISQRLERSEGYGGSSLLQAIAAGAFLDTAELFSGDTQIALMSATKTENLLVVAFPFVMPTDTYSHAIILIARNELLEEIFADSADVAGYIVDKKGFLLGKSPELAWNLFENIASREIVHHALESKLGNGQLRFVDSAGIAKLGVFRALGIGGLKIVTEVPEARAFEASKRAIARTALFAIIILLASLLIGLYFADSITSPLGELVRAARRIGYGDFSVTVPIQGSVEIALLSSSFNEMARGLVDRERVKELFHKFHNREIAEQILGGSIPLGGERKEVVVLFSDLRGFTSLSESMEPEQVVEMLNEYMTIMVAIVRKHNGIIDKFVGDAIMAVWGIPCSSPSDAVNAVTAALAMREALAELNKHRERRQQPALTIGIGINFGPVIAGNIGSNEKLEYTVIGDTVNIASRIEALSKEFNIDILLSKTVANRVDEQIALESCGRVQVKGKSGQVEVFKALGMRTVIVQQAKKEAA